MTQPGSGPLASSTTATEATKLRMLAIIIAGATCVKSWTMRSSSTGHASSRIEVIFEAIGSPGQIRLMATMVAPAVKNRSMSMLAWRRVRIAAMNVLRKTLSRMASENSESARASVMSAASFHAIPLSAVTFCYMAYQNRIRVAPPPDIRGRADVGEPVGRVGGAG
ncbi:MAG: hypothetical protein WCL53_04545 [Chloroflexota bacterium]